MQYLVSAEGDSNPDTKQHISPTVWQAEMTTTIRNPVSESFAGFLGIDGDTTDENAIPGIGRGFPITILTILTHYSISEPDITDGNPNLSIRAFRGSLPVPKPDINDANTITRVGRGFPLPTLTAELSYPISEIDATELKLVSGSGGDFPKIYCFV